MRQGSDTRIALAIEGQRRDGDHRDGDQEPVGADAGAPAETATQAQPQPDCRPGRSWHRPGHRPASEHRQRYARIRPGWQWQRWALHASRARPATATTKEKAETVWPEGKLCAVSLAPMMVICAASNTAAGRGSGTAILKPRLIAPASRAPRNRAQNTTRIAQAERQHQGQLHPGIAQSGQRLPKNRRQETALLACNGMNPPCQLPLSQMPSRARASARHEIQTTASN